MQSYKDILKQFGQGCVSLREQLEEDADFSDTDRLYIENCVILIELAYVEWKQRRGRASSPPPPSSTMPSSSSDDSGSTPTCDA